MLGAPAEDELLDEDRREQEHRVVERSQAEEVLRRRRETRGQSDAAKLGPRGQLQEGADPVREAEVEPEESATFQGGRQGRVLFEVDGVPPGQPARELQIRVLEDALVEPEDQDLHQPRAEMRQVAPAGDGQLQRVRVGDRNSEITNVVHIRGLDIAHPRAEIAGNLPDIRRAAVEIVQPERPGASFHVLAEHLHDQPEQRQQQRQRQRASSRAVHAVAGAVDDAAVFEDGPRRGRHPGRQPGKVLGGRHRRQQVEERQRTGTREGNVPVSQVVDGRRAELGAPRAGVEPQLRRLPRGAVPAGALAEDARLQAPEEIEEEGQGRPEGRSKLGAVVAHAAPDIPDAIVIHSRLTAAICVFRGSALFLHGRGRFPSGSAPRAPVPVF